MSAKTIVTLFGANSSGNQVATFAIVNPNATLSPFAIPVKRQFIVTDLDVAFNGAPPNSSVQVELLLFGDAPFRVFQDITTADSGGFGGLQSSLTTGVVIARNTVFAVTATPNPTSISVNLHGIFVKDDDD